MRWREMMRCFVCDAQGVLVLTTRSKDPIVHVVGAAILRGGLCLVAQRSATMSAPLKWEFPGGKVEPGESPERALARELCEELGVRVEVGTHLGVGSAVNAGRTIVLDVYAATWLSGELHLAEHAQIAWCDAKRLQELDWAEPDVPIIPAVQQALAESVSP